MIGKGKVILTEQGEVYIGIVKDVKVLDDYVEILLKNKEEQYIYVQLPENSEKKIYAIELIFEMLNDDIAVVDLQGYKDALESF
jgi:hypothetical protein